MDIEQFRAYCLSLEGVCDRMPFGKAASEYDRNLLVFSVSDKWFCFVNIDAFDFCTIKCDTEQIGELQALYEGTRPAYHMNKKHWISIGLNADIPDREVFDLVRRAYEIVVASLTKKQREALRNFR